MTDKEDFDVLRFAREQNIKVNLEKVAQREETQINPPEIVLKYEMELTGTSREHNLEKRRCNIGASEAVITLSRCVAKKLGNEVFPDEVHFDQINELQLKVKHPNDLHHLLRGISYEVANAILSNLEGKQDIEDDRIHCVMEGFQTEADRIDTALGKLNRRVGKALNIPPFWQSEEEIARWERFNREQEDLKNDPNWPFGI